ncbi:DUF6252 family protein [Paenimyroides aestuarii]|uniref:DUF6252 family protein n=1 Tax=Paenimyroides aestuarii TaxID=2968490 RepID=A0ABY5NU50_9FLAO|nr:DUF6252 family protein [Paenimyroides aestuarii]UUV22117.1 DUF6252 family protein [Paenimyroides aestuarii]
MKKLLFILAIIALFISCNKDDDPTPTPVNPVEQLPPATQNGAVMLACTVNGIPYICKDYSQVTSYYQWVNGGYGFVITGRKKTSLIWSIFLSNLGNSPIESNNTYILNSNNPGYGAGADVVDFNSNTIERSKTTATYTGEMTITKFDVQNEIVSGTFWFDIQNPWTGEKIEIRDGRFDTRFSQ